VLLRGALARTPSLTSRVYDAWRAGEFVLLVSDAILAELDAVTSRPEVARKLRVTPREARAPLVRIRRRAVVIRPEVTIRLSRDPTDDKFLECAVAGGADYLVSADDDLLALREVHGIPIVDVPTFWARLVERREHP
jgi:hypothetical protein